MSNWVLSDLHKIPYSSILVVAPQGSRSVITRSGLRGLWGVERVERVRLVVWCKGVRLRGGDWQINRLFWCLDGGRCKFGLYISSVFYGEISLSPQKVDICLSLGDKMEDEG